MVQMVRCCCGDLRTDSVVHGAMPATIINKRAAALAATAGDLVNSCSFN
jgi:hypothetical protein